MVVVSLGGFVLVILEMMFNMVFMVLVGENNILLFVLVLMLVLEEGDRVVLVYFELVDLILMVIVVGG